MVQRLWLVVLSLVACMVPLAISSAQTAPTLRPEGTLTVAVATFGNERWLPHLYPGAEDVVLKPMMENLLTRDPKTGALSPMLAERWENDPDRKVFTVPTALSLMVFFALCCQCASTLAVIRRETRSWAWPAFTFGYMTALAYVGALATFQAGRLVTDLAG